MLVVCTNVEAFVPVVAHSSDSYSMDVVVSHEDRSSSSSSSTLDTSTETQVVICELNGFDCTPQQILEESVFPSLTAGDPVDQGCELPLDNLEQAHREPEEELHILSEEEYQQLWDSLMEMEVQAPPPEQQVEVKGPPEAEVEVEATGTVQSMQDFPAVVDLSGGIQECGSQDGQGGDKGEPTPEEWEWDATRKEFDGEEMPVRRVVDALVPVVPPGKSVGITFHNKNNVWEAHLWISNVTIPGRKKKGVQIFLGTFASAKDAAFAHDRAAIKLQRQISSLRGKPYPLNYPEAEQAAYMEAHSDWCQRDFIWKIRRNSTRFSKGVSELKGVSLRRRSKRGQEKVVKYEAKLSQTAKDSLDGKKKSYMLGLYGSEEEAGRMYDLALLFLHSHLPEVEQWGCITNFRPSSYCSAEIEAMRRILVR